ncbi:MAG: tetratricopeptide repeat protein [Pseudomonadota bacterium]
MRIDFAEIQQKVRIYHSVSRFEAAEKMLLSAIDEHGSMANLHNLLGVTFHKQSKFADAIVQFTKALKINQNFVEAGLNLSATFCDLGRYDDAKSVFSEILATTPLNKKQPDLVLGRLANQHAECGHLYAQSNLPHEAINEYKRALALYERMPDVKIALGQLYFTTAQYDRALYEFQDAIRMFPDEAEAHLWLGVCLWKMERRDHAVSSWETSRNLDASNTLPVTYLKFSQLSPT